MSDPNTVAGTKRIVLIDDHQVMREGFARLIEEEPDLEVCAQFDSARGVCAGLAKLNPDLVVVDICLEDTHGLELIKDIRVQQPKLPILALSMYDESVYAERAVRAGANGYIMKRAPAEMVIQAIREVLKGELWLGAAVRNRMVNRFLGRKADSASSLEGLSDREFEVFQLIGQGLKTRQIADRLKISPKTVDTYRAHLKEKLNLDHGPDLVRHAVHWVEREGV